VRLRWVLAMTFFLLSAVQLVVVVPLAFRNLNGLLRKQHEAKVAQVMQIANGERQRTEHEIERALDELQSSEALDLAIRDATLENPPPSATHAAENVMLARGLQVLTIVDATGRTVSSGHLPARFGESNDELFSVTKLKPRSVVVTNVQLSTAQGLIQVPALVSFRAIEPKLFLVGGLLLDAQRATDLALLTGARVEIISENNVFATAGEPSTLHTDRTLTLSNSAAIRLSISQDDLAATQREVLRGFLVLAALGLVLSVLVGFLASRRVTRPIEALTDAASHIAKGAPGVTVNAAHATHELKQFIGVFNTMTTDLKSATDRLLASERVAAWQEVARRLAHEIKNPLTPIRMSLETLLAASQRGQLDERFRGLFTSSAKAVLEEVDRLKRIVDEFSQFARLPKPQLQLIELGTVVNPILALYENRESQRFTHSIAPGIMLQADKDLLTQVLVNLIKNAEEAMTESPGLISVRIYSADQKAILEVEDEGPGIKEELKARLFEPYVTTKPQGTGLGLAIAARIVQEHQGTISIHNGTNKGTIVRIQIPLAA
jgi:two-component system, NtrC family, nitrogen regulation sensor histidine kinase NtrY